MEQTNGESQIIHDTGMLDKTLLNDLFAKLAPIKDIISCPEDLINRCVAFAHEYLVPFLRSQLTKPDITPADKKAIKALMERINAENIGSNGKMVFGF